MGEFGRKDGPNTRRVEVSSMRKRRRRVRITDLTAEVDLLLLLVLVARRKRPPDLLLFLLLLLFVLIIMVVVVVVGVLDTDDGARKVRRTDDGENALMTGLVNASVVPNADNDTTVRMRRVMVVFRLVLRVIVVVFIVFDSCFLYFSVLR